MNAFTRSLSTFALLLCSTATALADDSSWVTCRDGMKMHDGGSCEPHGGVRIEETKTVRIPIKSNQAVTPINAAVTPKTPPVKATTKSKKKAVATATRNPTAKCMDGAQAFTRERLSACVEHGGVKKWYGW